MSVFLAQSPQAHFSFARQQRQRAKKKPPPPLLVAVLYVLLLIVVLVTIGGVHCNNDELEDDLTFTYHDSNKDDSGVYAQTDTTRKTTNRRGKMKSRPPAPGPAPATSSVSSSSTASTLATSSTVKGPLLGLGLGLGATSSSSSAPYVYASERINQTHADMFGNWIDKKSEELYEMTMNFSGYKLLNETYSIKLRGDAKFSWINFTEMIVNISQTISEVLYNKTVSS